MPCSNLGLGKISMPEWKSGKRIGMVSKDMGWMPKSWLIGKDPDAGRDCGQEEKGTTKDEMAGCHH